jgi:hypothetical protein
MAGNVIQIGHNTHVVIGGPNHGLYITKTVERNGEKKTYEEKITDWIAWPAEVMTRLRINDRCHPETVGDEEYTCEVVTSTGRHYVRPGYAAKDAASASTVIDTCHAGVELPVSQSHVKVANNMLRTLGHNDQRKNAEYASMGWCYVDGETPVYLAPHGSITPDGVIDSYTVGAYGGDDAGLGAAMRRTGFADATLPVHEAAKAIELFCKIAPHRPEIAIALIGLMASAPLRLSTRAVVVITGETDAGKTLLSSAVQTFFADVAVGQKEAASLYIPSSSPVGAAGVTAWYRDGLAVCDDYRRDDSNKQANETMAQILSTVVQAAYGAAPSAKATQTGGMRESRDQAASALITAEVSADQSAIRNRGITLTLAKVDRVTTPGGAIDIFKRAADTGAARSLMAHYITYLARRATMYPDGLARMKKAMTTRSQRNYVSLSRTTGGRASETVAALMTGWETFREFAKDAGIESVLPSKKTVETALRSLAASNASLAAEADPGRRVLDQMAAMLAGNTAHLVAHHGGQPDLDGHSLGWVATTTHSFSGTTTRWDAKGPMLGTLSEDGTVVVVGKTGVQAAMPGARLDGLAPSQVYEALGRLTVQGTNPGGHCPTSLGIKSRPEGYVVPVALLGIGFASDETPEPEFESELELEHDTF